MFLTMSSCQQTEEAKKIIKNYNKMAAVLLEFEVRQGLMDYLCVCVQGEGK